MSEPIQGAAATGAPTESPQSPSVEPATPATPEPAKAAEAATSPQGGGLSLTSEQLKERLERAKTSAQADLLKSLGVSSLDDIKAAVEAKRQQEEAQKSLEERLASERAERERDSAELARYRETVAQRAQQELDSLSEEQRAAVSALAGDDPAQLLSAITALRPTWASAAPAQPKKPAEAASTAPPRTQPGDGTTSKPSRLAEYERLKSNPETRAASLVYLNQHSREIFAEQRNRAD